MTTCDLVQTIRHHTRRLVIATMLVPVIGVAAQLGAGATLPSAACGDATPYRWLPTGGNVTASHLTGAQVAALGSQKAALDARNPAAVAEMQRTAAASPTRAEKVQRMSAMSHTPVTTSNLSMDAACGATGAQRGSLFARRVRATCPDCATVLGCCRRSLNCAATSKRRYAGNCARSSRSRSPCAAWTWSAKRT